jgi:hypothetical protein
MLNKIRNLAVIVGIVTSVVSSRVLAQAPSTTAKGNRARPEPNFSCRADNDLYRAVSAAGGKVARFDSPETAIDRAAPNAAVLILADDYPAKTVNITRQLFATAKRKRLQLYVEYPTSIPGHKLGEPQQVHWERAVVASNSIDLGLPKSRILSLHDCRFLPTEAADPLIFVARVAGFDTAVYGLPKERYPILFKTQDGTIVATTQLSNFNTGRYAPTADWPTLWKHLLDELDPHGAPHELKYTPTVRPSYEQKFPLPADAEVKSLASAADWVHRSRLLISKEREPEIVKLLQSGAEEVPPPSASEPTGDGSRGILEGYASRIEPDGSQTQRLPIRADCQAETAAVLAMHSSISGDSRSRQTAESLLNYLYVTSELHQGERGNPRHPAFGLIAWGAVAPAWQVGNYGDDNARTLLATMVAAASLDSHAWDAAMLNALYANLRTTGTLGFRGDRVDVPVLEQYGWRHFHDAETRNVSPHFEGYLWACYLWAYARTGDREFLDRTKTAIRITMELYPKGWRWSDNLERAHMLLPLAWLVRVDDSPVHREWLTRVANDMLADQAPCGAIAERLRAEGGGGHYVVPKTNEAYGTSETPLLQRDGDPVSDQLYTTGFALLGLHEAAAATGDAKLRVAEDRLADFLVRIQVRSETVPYVDGTWFRAFDFGRWDYWASSADMGWGAWCIESGWGPAWIPVVFGLREKETSLWDFTASSQIARQSDAVKKLMSENDGKPFVKQSGR